MRLLLIISGGIAAYKSLELVRLLRRHDIAVRCILTKAATQFVTPLSVAALSGDRVYGEMFSLTEETEMGHIALSRSADVVLVCPATADILAKMAHGLADDLATTALLATDKPVIVAPAMNVRMWEHPATRANLATLRARGVKVIPPTTGAMACGEYGEGRLPEPDDLLQHVLAFFGQGQPLRGKTALVTAGGTCEPLDPVRFIGNRSSGKMGFAVAKALAQAGANVTLVYGMAQGHPPAGVKAVHAPTAGEMHTACLAALPVDIAVCTAAVADWQSPAPALHKQKKQPGQDTRTLELVKTPDILASLNQSPHRPRLLVGFAAETENMRQNAEAKRISKGCDWVVVNTISADNPAFGADVNQVHLLTGDGWEEWPVMAKTDIARELVGRIVSALPSSCGSEA